MEYTKGDRAVEYNDTKGKYEVRLYRKGIMLGTLALFTNLGDALLDASAPDLYEACNEFIESDKADPYKKVATIDGHAVSASGLARYHMRQALAKAEGK